MFSAVKRLYQILQVISSIYYEVLQLSYVTMQLNCVQNQGVLTFKRVLSILILRCPKQAVRH